MSVSAREKLRKLIGLPEGKFLSDFEMEIEYETELAHLDFTRKWLVKAHEDWIAENEAEKAKMAAIQETEVKGCECKSERAVTLPDPHTLEIEFLNLSDKATANLKKVGIDMLSDCTAHSVAELQDLIGIKPTSIIEKALGMVLQLTSLPSLLRKVKRKKHPKAQMRKGKRKQYRVRKGKRTKKTYRALDMKQKMLLAFLMKRHLKRPLLR